MSSLYAHWIKVQLFLSSQRSQKSLLADAIESIARKNIVSAFEMAVSARKGVFASIVITNLWLLE